VEVFERRSGTADQPLSHGIHLDADGLRALHTCLPAENWARLVATSVPARDLIRFRDQHLRILTERDRQTPENATDPITRRRAVSRDALREALLLGLDGIVRWDKQFSGYSQAADGTVTARFADGSTSTGDLLVGADGSGSRVRTQRLPGLDRVDLGVVTIAGRATLTPSLADALPPTLTDSSINNIVPSGPGWMFASTWHGGRPTAEQSHEVPTAVPGEDYYVVWAWAGARESYPADVEKSPPEALRDLVAGRVQDWSPAVGRLVADTDVTTVAAMALRSMPVLDPWPSNEITLIGDAIHNMTPMAGIGANTALRDAAALSQALRAPGDLRTRVGRYEDTMRAYANEALAMSTRNARNAASEARFPRLAFRSMLRLAEAVPPVKRAMFGLTPNTR
jgi:2-polyprenyl-6-methoxyphenol hydroxylase-like FAD-dependent oxidoreductase